MDDVKELENIRLNLITEMNDKFDEVLKDLNENGTEYSRMLKKDLDVMRENATRDFEEIWSFTKSKLVSVEQGQKLFYENIFPRLMNKIELAVKMARDSAQCTSESFDTVKDAKKEFDDRLKLAEAFVRDSRVLLMWFFVTVAVAVLSVGGAKLYQDWINQNQTVNYLNKLVSGVNIKSVSKDDLKKIIDNLGAREKSELMKKLKTK